MLNPVPLPATHPCTVCTREHYVRVKFCPYCGTEQADPVRKPTAVTPRVPPAQADPEVPAARQSRIQSATQHAPSSPVVPQTVEMQPSALPKAKPAPRRGRYVLAAAAITALIVYGSRTRQAPPLPSPRTLTVGSAWTDIDLSAFQSVPLVGLRSQTALRFRTNEERVQLVQPGTEVAIRTGGVRKLEVRTVSGRAEVTLAPQPQ